GIPVAMSIPSASFFDINISDAGLPPDSLQDTRYGDELRYILQIEEKTNQFGDRLRAVYNAGQKGPIDYPSLYPYNAPRGRQRNPLSYQFEIIARLLAGGCKTKIFLTRIGGFDTHAEQVEPTDASMGNHA